MKSHLKLTSLLIITSIVAYGQSQIFIDGTAYSNGQTVYLECGRTTVSAAIPVLTDANNQEITVFWDKSTNFTITPTNVSAVVTLNLDPNKNDGDVKAVYYNNGGTSNGITVYIKQKPPVPTFTTSPSLCSIGSSAVFAVSDNYLFQSTKPINLVWQTAGGVTVNGSSSYTENSSTSSSVNVGLASRGLVYVYAIVPGCNNLQSASTTSLYLGTPQLANFTVGSSVNPGPYPVSPGSTHYFSNTSAFNYVPSYSINSITNSGNIALNLTGVSGGSGQINVSGSVGNATLRIVASNSCGSDSRDAIFYIPSYYRASPNPAKSDLTVAFENTDYEYGLPDQLEIVSEKEKNVVRAINVQDAFRNKAFKNGKEISFDVSNLERGTYYLRVVNPRQTESKKVEMIRLILE